LDAYAAEKLCVFGGKRLRNYHRTFLVKLRPAA